MHLQEIFDLTLTQGHGKIKQCPLHHVPYVPASLKLQRPMGQEMHLQENTQRSRESRSHEMLPSTLDIM